MGLYRHNGKENGNYYSVAGGSCDAVGDGAGRGGCGGGGGMLPEVTKHSSANS